MKEMIALGDDVGAKPRDDLVDRVAPLRQRLVEARGESGGGVRRGNPGVAGASLREVVGRDLHERTGDLRVRVGLYAAQDIGRSEIGGKHDDGDYAGAASGRSR